jgi:hypothetical protein
MSSPSHLRGDALDKCQQRSKRECWTGGDGRKDVKGSKARKVPQKTKCAVDKCLRDPRNTLLQHRTGPHIFSSSETAETCK